ncbi:MAG TPA: DUF2461 family protein [Clostridia bacterium]|nr:MAG: hypothetical protein BWX97_00575 [Firmicutes bacterium ADurb.Bin146]HOD93427.1 DUF2461 family protein [Clostridia bacterium]HQM39673.1 DUF2461 family protein [Clostridia bacterium]
MKTENKAFNGFPEEMTKFLYELQFTNTVEKQEDNIVKYREYITNPLITLYESLIPTVKAISSKLEATPRRCLSTPYTDRRFSPNAPLKEYMYIRYRHACREEDCIGLYFDMGLSGYSFGMRIYDQTSNGMDVIRKKILSHPEKFEEQLNILKDAGFIVLGDKYKRDHFPDVHNDMLKEILNRKYFYICKDLILNDKIYTSQLRDDIEEGFNQLKGLIQLLEDINNDNTPSAL